MDEKLIVFVCTGNTCRSPIAEAIMCSECKRFNIKNVEVKSAGIQVNPNSQINMKSAQVLAENGLSLENFNPTQLNEDILLNAFAIICMTNSQKEFLLDIKDTIIGKEACEKNKNLFSFLDFVEEEIPDPYGKDIDVYRNTYNKINASIIKILTKLDLIEILDEKPEVKNEIKTETKKKSTSTAKSKKSTKTSTKKRGRKKGSTKKKPTNKKVEDK